jgi:predicted lipid-binding transport protein (Tim44 family)
MWRTPLFQSVLLSFVFLLFVSAAEARVGSGRSFGSRGSRGMSPRSPSTPTYRQPRSRSYSDSAPYRPSPWQASPQGGGFLRSLGAGMAGGFLGSMLFRGLGHASPFGGVDYGGGGGGFGFLEILLVLGLLYGLFRWMTRSRLTPAAQGSSVFGSSQGLGWNTFRSEPEQVQPPLLQPVETSFDAEQFKEERTDDFFKLQAALMNRDLTPVLDCLTPEISQQLEMDLNSLKSSHRMNRLENITVREAEIVESWQESGKEFATLRLKANLLDYTVDEVTGTLVSGSRTEPVKFEEFWTFVRSLNYGDQKWRLTAIQNSAP